MPLLPSWAQGGAIERAKAAFLADGGFLPITARDGKILDSAWSMPGNPSWVNMAGGPGRIALAQLDNLKAAGAEIQAEIERRTGGYFAKMDAATVKYQAAQVKSKAAIDKMGKIVGYQRKMPLSEWEDKYRQKYTQAKNEVERLRLETSGFSGKVNDLRNVHPAKDIQAVLGELRPMGGELNLKEIEDGRLVSAEHDGLTRAAESYPRAWIDRSNADALPLTLRTGTGELAERGYYVSGNGRIVVSDSPTNAVHELGHRMEHTNLDVTKSEWAFWHSRTDGEETVLLRDLKVGSGYSDAERGRKDAFSDVYMGKTYGDNPNSAYELLTMGMENMQKGVYHVDPEYRQWLLGTLGLL